MSGTADETRRENQAGDPEFFTGPGEGDGTGRDTSEDVAAVAGDADVEIRHGNDYTADPDSGFYGAGRNEGDGNDNLARETTPGYQADKWDRGTIMPR